MFIIFIVIFIHLLIFHQIWYVVFKTCNTTRRKLQKTAIILFPVN
jgi:hypothetical protein